MSEEKSPVGFYLQRRRPEDRKKHNETPEEEGIANMMDRTFLKEVQLDAIDRIASTLEADGTPSEVVEGALGMLMADPLASRFSGAMGSRNPITPRELQAKERAIKKYKEYRDYLGAEHPYTQKWLTACQVIIHNHITRSVDADALRFKPVVPWSIAGNKPGYNSGTPKKDSMEAD
jgi:hypothetical protein